MLWSLRQSLQGIRCQVVIVGCLFILSIVSANQGLLAAAQAEESMPVEAISAVLASIERAWSEGNADAIVERFGARKVLLRLPDNPQSSRRFSHQQSLLILRDHFRRNEIRHFGFVRTQVPETSGGKAIGLGEVTWRRHGLGRTMQGRLLLVLEQEDERWVLTEVLALP